MVRSIVRIFPFASLLLCHFNEAIAQNQDKGPIHWEYNARKTGDKEYELHFTAIVDEGWHVYSQTQPKDAIAHPTEIIITPNPLVHLKDKIREVGALIKWSDPVTGLAAHQYTDRVDFVQIIHLKAKVKTQVRGSLSFQACTDEMCLPAKTLFFIIPLP